jgi:hypothetical protein
MVTLAMVTLVMVTPVMVTLAMALGILGLVRLSRTTYVHI